VLLTVVFHPVNLVTVMIINLFLLLVVLPEGWEQQDTDVKVFTLEDTAANEEFWRVASLFFQTLPNAEIRTIKRIQNRALWKKYSIRAKSMQEENVPCREKALFHGTCSTDPKEIYEGNDSFDMRLSRDGMWGRGNYFAVNALYSDGYAHHQRQGNLKKLLLAQVLTGISYFSPPIRFTRPPLCNATTGQVGTVQRRYDSVCGQTGGSMVYITYENNLAYPAYIIAYTT